MKNMQTFEHPVFGEIRVLYEDGKMMFCGVDVARALGYAQPHKAINRHCRYGTRRTVPHPQTAEKEIEMIFIPEGDVYRLTVRSKVDGAERFESWIFDEVVPSVVKTGSYSVAPVPVRKIPDVSPSGLARLLETMEKHTLMSGGSADDIIENDKRIFEVYGVPLTPYLENYTPRQISLFDSPSFRDTLSLTESGEV